MSSVTSSAVLYCSESKRSTGPLVTCDYFPFFVTGLRCKSVQGIAVDVSSDNSILV